LAYGNLSIYKIIYIIVVYVCIWLNSSFIIIFVNCFQMKNAQN
jgi:hypothetical protein